MNMFVERLHREYPQVTKSFEQVVEQTVQEQLDKSYAENNTGRKAGGLQRMFRMVAPVAVCICLVCGTVVAANNSLIQQWLDSLGSNREAAERLVENDVKPVYGEKEPLLEIDSTYMDGTRLVYTAKLRDGAESHPYAAKDHVKINGIDCLNEYFKENPAGSGCYEGSVMFSNEFLANCGSPEMLDITLQLYMSEGVSVEETQVEIAQEISSAEDLSAANQAIEEFTFSIPAEGLEQTQMAGLQKIKLESGSVNVITASVAPSGIRMQLQFEFPSDVAEEMLAVYKGGYQLVDSNGVVMDIRDCARVYGYGDPVKGTDTWTMLWDAELTSFDCTSDTITFIPYSSEYDEKTGKRIPDTETLYEDKAFTVNLVTQ